MDKTLREVTFEVAQHEIESDLRTFTVIFTRNGVRRNMGGFNGPYQKNWIT